MIYPTYDDIVQFWDKQSDKDRLEYVIDVLDCEASDSIAIAISKRHWKSLPTMISNLIEGYSQIYNDVFNTLNVSK